jgi:hypothetical protein
VPEPALDAIERQRSELFPFGNNFMKAILCNLAAVGCLLALIDLPSEFYKVLRFVVVAACIAVILEIQKSESAEKVKTWTSIGFGMLAVIYNPFLPLSLDREEWFWINCASAMAFLAYQLRKRLTASLEAIKARLQERKGDRPSSKLSRLHKAMFCLLGVSTLSMPSIFFIKEDRSGVANLLFGVLMASSLGITILMGVDELLNGEKYRNNAKRKKEFQQFLTRVSKAGTPEEQDAEFQKYMNKNAMPSKSKSTERQH